MTKTKSQTIGRLTLIGFLLFGSLLMVDYLMMLRIESLLDDHEARFDTLVEADICNAITDKTYLGPRFFIKQILQEREVKFEILQGHCSRGRLTNLRVIHKKNI